MGTPRKPLALLALSGTLDHDKKRYADRVAEPVPAAEMPSDPTGWKWMTPLEQECYCELHRLAYRGTCGEPDTAHVQLTAGLLAEMRTDFRNMPTPRVVALMNALGRLGMNPADRSRVRALEGTAPPAATKARGTVHEFAKAPRKAVA